MEKKYYTCKEVADLLGVSIWLVYNLYHRDQLRGVKVGKTTIRFDIDDINKFLKKRED